MHVDVHIHLGRDAVEWLARQIDGITVAVNEVVQRQGETLRQLKELRVEQAKLLKLDVEVDKLEDAVAAHTPQPKKE